MSSTIRKPSKDEAGLWLGPDPKESAKLDKAEKMWAKLMRGKSFRGAVHDV